MGKYGSKRKLTVEECLDLDISELVKAGALKDPPGKPWVLRWPTQENPRISRFKMENCGKDIRLSYAVVNNVSRRMDHMDYAVGIVRTPCHFGGSRRWFLCPFPKEGRPCGRRVGKLYLLPGGKYFGCRQCHNLAYQSQRESWRVPRNLWKLLTKHA